MELATTILAIFTVVAAMGLVGVMAVQILSEARGCRNGIAVNASQGRCLH
jgi:hypothetical protein